MFIRRRRRKVLYPYKDKAVYIYLANTVNGAQNQVVKVTILKHGGLQGISWIVRG